MEAHWHRKCESQTMQKSSCIFGCFEARPRCLHFPNSEGHPQPGFTVARCWVDERRTTRTSDQIWPVGIRKVDLGPNYGDSGCLELKAGWSPRERFGLATNRPGWSKTILTNDVGKENISSREIILVILWLKKQQHGFLRHVLWKPPAEIQLHPVSGLHNLERVLPPLFTYISTHPSSYTTYSTRTSSIYIKSHQMYSSPVHTQPGLKREIGPPTGL